MSTVEGFGENVAIPTVDQVRNISDDRFVDIVKNIFAIPEGQDVLTIDALKQVIAERLDSASVETKKGGFLGVVQKITLCFRRLFNRKIVLVPFGQSKESVLERLQTLHQVHVQTEIRIEERKRKLGELNTLCKGNDVSVASLRDLNSKHSFVKASENIDEFLEKWAPDYTTFQEAQTHTIEFNDRYFLYKGTRYLDALGVKRALADEKIISREERMRIAIENVTKVGHWIQKYSVLPASTTSIDHKFGYQLYRDPSVKIPDAYIYVCSVSMRERGQPCFATVVYDPKNKTFSISTKKSSLEFIPLKGSVFHYSLHQAGFIPDVDEPKPKVPDAPKVPDEAKVPDAPKVPDEAKVPDAPKVPDEAQISDAPKDTSMQKPAIGAQPQSDKVSLIRSGMTEGIAKQGSLTFAAFKDTVSILGQDAADTIFIEKVNKGFLKSALRLISWSTPEEQYTIYVWNGSAMRTVSIQIRSDHSIDCKCDGASFGSWDIEKGFVDNIASFLSISQIKESDALADLYMNKKVEDSLDEKKLVDTMERVQRFIARYKQECAGVEPSFWTFLKDKNGMFMYLKCTKGVIVSVPVLVKIDADQKLFIRQKDEDSFRSFDDFLEKIPLVESLEKSVEKFKKHTASIEKYGSSKSFEDLKKLYKFVDQGDEFGGILREKTFDVYVYSASGELHISNIIYGEDQKLTVDGREYDSIDSLLEGKKTLVELEKEYEEKKALFLKKFTLPEDQCKSMAEYTANLRFLCAKLQKEIFWVEKDKDGFKGHILTPKGLSGFTEDVVPLTVDVESMRAFSPKTEDDFSSIEDWIAGWRPENALTVQEAFGYQAALEEAQNLCGAQFGIKIIQEPIKAPSFSRGFGQIVRNVGGALLSLVTKPVSAKIMLAKGVHDGDLQKKSKQIQKPIIVMYPFNPSKKEFEYKKFQDGKLEKKKFRIIEDVQGKKACIVDTTDTDSGPIVFDSQNPITNWLHLPKDYATYEEAMKPTI